MGALARVAMDWLERLVNFHMLNGVQLEKYPKLDDSGSVLIYYSLKQAVDSLGGFAMVSQQNLWKEVCSKLKLPSTPGTKMSMGETLNNYYREVILPFENFLSFLRYAGVTNGECRYRSCNLTASRKSFNTQKVTKKILQVSPKVEFPEISGPDTKVSDYQLSAPSYSADVQPKAAPVSPPDSPVAAVAKRLRRKQVVSIIDDSENSEFSSSDNEESPKSKKQHPRGTNARIASEKSSQSSKRVLRNFQLNETSSDKPEMRKTTRRSSRKDLEDFPSRMNTYKKTFVKVKEEEEDDDEEQEEEDEVTICEICERECLADGYDSLSCKECEGLFHRPCIATSEIFIQPKADTEKWFCARCLVGSCEFAFEPGPVYSLGDFQDLAEDFKEDYLEKNPELESLDDEGYDNDIERRFWESVETTGDSITVEYGSDIHCGEKGSGFPIRAKDPYNRYSKDMWNLNNMPHHKDSLFHQIKSDISGMTVPWLYVGMMFSTFCWHSEDHYTYSVNYQHFGDTKTWYGIPGADAEKFENAMKDTVPELFEKQPNLLFQLVTMISPKVLVAKGVRCYAIDQGPGEFVITFPKAYHSGFNHGFNCNEAVNFAPPDWVSYGAESVDTYQRFNRAPVFSHDSLLLRTAKVDLRPKTAQWLYPQINLLVERELAKRKQILLDHQDLPVEYLNKEVSEEDYQCCVCNSLPYLSRITYSRTKKRKQARRQTRRNSRSPKVSAANDEESDDDDSLNNDTDLMEVVFGRPTVSEEGEGLARPKRTITACHLHIPKTIPSGVVGKLQITRTNDELEELRSEILRRCCNDDELLKKSNLV